MAASTSGRVIDDANGRLRRGQLGDILVLQNNRHQLLVES